MQKKINNKNKFTNPVGRFMVAAGAILARRIGRQMNGKFHTEDWRSLLSNQSAFGIYLEEMKKERRTSLLGLPFIVGQMKKK